MPAKARHEDEGGGGSDSAREGSKSERGSRARTKGEALQGEGRGSPWAAGPLPKMGVSNL